MPKLRNFLFYWLPPLLWMVLVFSASADRDSYRHSSTLFEPLLHWLFPSLSQAHVELIHHAFRKAGHLTEFAILALLFWRAIRQPGKNHFSPWNWAEAGLSLAMVFLYAGTDELHQVFVATRNAQVSDVMIDTIGGGIGLLLLWLGGIIFKRW